MGGSDRVESREYRGMPAPSKKRPQITVKPGREKRGFLGEWFLKYYVSCNIKLAKSGSFFKKRFVTAMIFNAALKDSTSSLNLLMSTSIRIVG